MAIVTDKPITSWKSAYDDIVHCEPCQVKMRTTPNLRGAAASVGIEHGMSTAQVMVSFIYNFHKAGHID